jgi:hypothetical protein
MSDQQNPRYRVIRPFKDAKGRSWAATEQFEGDQEATSAALAAGNIAEHGPGGGQTEQMDKAQKGQADPAGTKPQPNR